MSSQSAIRSVRKIFEAKRFNVEEVVHSDPSGQSHTRHIVRHPGAVVILPIVDDEHVCLISNYRAAVDRHLLELPAGTLDTAEPIQAIAARELIEETGYRATQFRLIHQFCMSPGILDEKMYVFVATELTEGNPEREPGEWIDNKVLTWAEIDQLMQRGEIQDAKTIAALLYYLRYVKGV